MAKRNPIDFFFEVGTMRKIPRSLRQLLLAQDNTDSIASHTYRAAIIGYMLAKHEKANPYKVVMMCLFHDFTETRSGDQNWVNKRYVKAYEDEIIEEQLTGLTQDNEMLLFMKEYEKRVTLESKIAKDADILELALNLKEYAHVGNLEAKRWLKGRLAEKITYSKTAQKWGKEILDAKKVNGWWSDLWTAKRR